MRRDSRPPLPPAEEATAGGASGELDLVRRCRAGERSAFDQFYREHRRIVAATLFRVLGEAGEIEDVVQEVFVIAFRGMATFRGESKLSTWLYRICVNVALGKLRTRARRPVTIAVAEPIAEGVAVADGASPEQLLLRREDVARVYAALDQLPPKKRITLILHEIQGLDIKEIAAIVGAPVVTVRTRLHYARKAFYALVAVGEGSK